MTTERQTRRKGGFEIFVVMPGVFLALGHLSNLYTWLTRGEISVRMERENPSPVTTIDGVSLPIEGIFAATVPLADLSAAAATFLIASSIVFAAGLITSSWFFSSALSSISDGPERTARVLKYLWVTLFVLAGTFLVGGLSHMIGILGLELDLGINVQNGYDLTSIFAGIGILAIISAIIASVKRSERAEAETEGLV